MSTLKIQVKLNKLMPMSHEDIIREKANEDFDRFAELQLALLKDARAAPPSFADVKTWVA